MVNDDNPFASPQPDIETPEVVLADPMSVDCLVPLLSWLFASSMFFGLLLLVDLLMLSIVLALSLVVFALGAMLRVQGKGLWENCRPVALIALVALIFLLVYAGVAIAIAVPFVAINAAWGGWAWRRIPRGRATIFFWFGVGYLLGMPLAFFGLFTGASGAFVGFWLANRQSPRTEAD